jgi:membrane dipeptidase
MQIFDGHNDILNKITGSADPMDTRAFLVKGSGQMDFTRALKGGFCGGFFAVYPSNPPEVPSAEERLIQGEDGYHIPLAPSLPYDFAHNAALGMIKLLKKIESDSMGQLRIVTEISEIHDCLEKNVMSAILHLEGAEPIHPDLSNLENFYEEGMRSLGITWSRPNAFGHGVPFEYPGHPDSGPGLTDAGKKLVKVCNELGIMIDLAHLNEKGFWDVANQSDAPLVSTHTAAHNLVPKARNLTDEQLQAIQKSNGVVGVIFSVNDLDGGKRPKDDAPISAIITHIQYIADLIGVDHVAFGSDFDGTKIPSELGDISNFQLLVDLLEEAGFSHLEREKICRKNWFRVLEKTWKSHKI